MKAIESSGATREEAIQSALKELGVEMDSVERIDVIDEGSKGFLGLGKRPVRVRIAVDHAQLHKPQDTQRRHSGPRRQPRGGQQRNRGKRGGDGSGAARQEQHTANKPAASGQNNRRDKNKGRNQTQGQKRQQPGNRPVQKAGAPRKEEGGRRLSAQSPKKPANGVCEESLEAQRLVEQFDNMDAAAASTYQEPERSIQDAEKEAFESISNEQGTEAAALLEEIISYMDLQGKVSFCRDKEGSARLHVDSEADGGILIGKRGMTLEAFQYLINRMLTRGDSNENSERVLVDVGDYVDRRRGMLRDMALSMAQKAKDTNRNVRLKPLSPQDRRIIHLSLEKDKQIRTFSTGDSLFRTIVISPLGERKGNNQRHNSAGNRNKRREGNANSPEE
ncbi:MAG: RNA-binding cell elongation regulator Jag/EloR [Candidatus Hydrogenedentales bacterium]|jgi:spoIIIJ-associated protein